MTCYEMQAPSPDRRTSTEGGAVLVMRRLWAGAPRYFLSAVGPDGDDAPRLGESPGRWAGAGAGARGLVGLVEGTALRQVLPEGAGRVTGFDFTFAAPKSLSVLHALGSVPVADAVQRAHDAAVTAGLAYLERHACAVRIAGEVVTAPGLVAATFRHRTSRASDPHLHTHALVVNVARGPDARERALHTALLYAERRGAAATYHVVLRGQLTTEIGLRWEPPRGGRSDAREVPAAVRAAFSRRRAAVLNEAWGEVGARRWAERVTRPDRSGLVDIERLTAGWHRRAGVLSWSPPGPGPGRVPRIGGLADVPPAADRWGRADVLVALADRWVDGGRAADLEDAARRVLASPEVVAVGRRFTTEAALARAEAVAVAFRGRWVDGDVESLDRLRREVARDGRRLVVVVGDAAAADHAHARTGAPSVTSAMAGATIERLRPGDVVVVRSPERLPSQHVAAVLDAVSRSGVAVLAGSPARHRDAPGMAVADAPARHRGAPGMAVADAPARHRDAPGMAVADAPAVTVPGPPGDVITSPCAVTAADTAIGDWLACRRTGAAAVLVAAPEEVIALNDRARAALRAAGLLGAPEVGGFATGDVLRFTRGRPASGIARHAVAEVVAVDVASGVVDARLGHGRRLTLSGPELRGVVHAHVVPPSPSLVAGRGDVFVVGGPSIAARHVGTGHLHRYVTAAVPEHSHHLAARQLDLGAGLSR